MIRALLPVAAGLALATLSVAPAEEAPPLVESIVTGVSQPVVSITADFSGEEILVYGAIERNRFLAEDERPPDVVLIVEGPERPVMVRKKERVAGVWVNRQHSVINAAPSFYAVGSTRPLDEALDPHQIDIYDVGLEQALLAPGAVSGDEDPMAFHAAAIRLMREMGFYVTLPKNVRLIGHSLFESRIALPASIVEGDYRVRVLLAREGRVIDNHMLIIPVRKAGLERWIYRLAQDDPIAYGLLSIFVAVLAGWLASETFRRLRA